MIRVAAFVDGFNLYHLLPRDSTSQKCLYRWLNLKHLCSLFCEKNENLQLVYYFTALTPWSADKRNRHQIYIKALEAKGVRVVYGRFQNVTRKCRHCRSRYKTYEEKHTDVSISLQVLQAAYEDQCDKFMLVTADSDFAPAVKLLRSKFAHKKVHIVFPSKHHSIELKGIEGCKTSTIKLMHLKSSLFANDLPKGIVKPVAW